MNTKAVVTVTEGSLTIGQHVTLSHTGPAYSSTSSGIYGGVRLSPLGRTDHGKEHTLYVYIVNGEINGTHQGIHGFPLSHLDVVPESLVTEVIVSLATSDVDTVVWREYKGYYHAPSGDWFEIASGPERVTSSELARILTAR